MARGKDGYKSLLVKPEGGECDEVVSEENGILISMMLRQYFMSLKVMDQWKCWGPSMERHWGAVVGGVCKSHPVMEPKPKSPVVASESGKGKEGEDGKRKRSSWAEWTPAKLRERRSSITPLVEESDGNGAVGGAEQQEEDTVRDMDREMRIMRKVFRKWCRIAGVQGQACDSLGEDEFEVDWTKAIAPRVEGRIVMV